MCSRTLPRRRARDTNRHRHRHRHGHGHRHRHRHIHRHRHRHREINTDINTGREAHTAICYCNTDFYSIMTSSIAGHINPKQS